MAHIVADVTIPDCVLAWAAADLFRHAVDELWSDRWSFVRNTGSGRVRRSDVVLASSAATTARADRAGR